jgi:CysZ protein
MIDAALAAAVQILSPPFRAVLWKTLALTLLLLGVLWIAAEKLVVAYVHLPYAWLATTIHVLAGLGLVVGVAFLVTPVAFLVAGFFFDELADHVEATIAGPEGRGRAMAIGPALWIGLRFAGVAVLVNLVALVLLLVLGRGFFELAALRYLPLEDVRDLRARHATRIILAGCVLAGLSLVPVLNLLTPLYAAAFMVRVAQPLLRRRLERRDPPVIASSRG